MQETIGLLMASVALQDRQGDLLSLAFLLVKEMPDGRGRPLSSKEKAAMRTAEFRPIAGIKTEAIHHGRKVTTSVGVPILSRASAPLSAKKSVRW